MLRPPHLLSLPLLVAFACQGPPAARGPAAVSEGPSWSERVAGLERLEGLYPLWLDGAEARLFLELPAAGEDGVLATCLYAEGLAGGLGSNDIGLDRGQIGPTRLIEFRRMGPRVWIEVPNLDYRVGTDDASERAAGRESFASSVLWSGAVEAEGPDGQVLVELTSFLVRDAHGSAATLGARGGSWSLDLERSALDVEATLAFPENLELEARLTFSGRGASREVREVAPDPTSVTLVQHHSFVALPDDGYQPRPWDPRTGSFARDFVDLTAHPSAPNRVRHAVRHRLERADPGAALSPAVEPLVYHVDRGAPEPVRSALVEGASWWNEAFEAAGFRDAFRVELLPEGAHPLDARYNVIQWVHRSSRGWSYGGGISDPRTGEMIKGHVVLGSLRVRQDRMLFDGLVGPGGPEGASTRAALARIRQLSAHEVGHTLGLAHNFAASTCGRASVMDYPPPRVGIGGGDKGLVRLVLDEAYAVGIGRWDAFAIRDLYGDPPAGQSLADWRAEAVSAARRAGLVYLSDGDARPAGAAEPRANLWDDGEDVLAGLRHVLRVRGIALEQFGAGSLPQGESMALLEEVLVPLYFMHRYQLEGAVKCIGGRHYVHELAGQEVTGPEVVAPERQREALDLLLFSLRESVELPPEAVAQLGPQTIVRGRRRETFAGRTAPEFDPVGLAEALAEMTLGALLVPERLARVVEQARKDPRQLGIDELLRRSQEVLLQGAPGLDPVLDEVLAGVWVGRLEALAASPAVAPAVRSAAELALERAARELASGGGDPWRGVLARRAERFLGRPWNAVPSEPAPRRAPPGSPIGCGHELPGPLEVLH